jgi:hypothetical protein
MCPVIDNPASCEVNALIMSAAEIHHELCMVYRENVMTEEETARQWCRLFKDGWANSVHDEERSGGMVICSD